MRTQRAGEFRKAGAIPVTAGLVIAFGLLMWLGLSRGSTGITPVGAAVTPSERASDRPGAASAVPVDVAIEVVRDPQAAIQIRIASATGNTCFVSAIRAQLRTSGEEWDRRIKAAGGVDRWIDPEVTWAGGVSGALKAFGAAWATQAEGRTGEVWIQVKRGETDAGVQLLRITTPSGQELWSAANGMVPSTDCG